MTFVDISIEGDTEPYTCPVYRSIDNAVLGIRNAYELTGGRIDQCIDDRWVAMESGDMFTVERKYRFKGGKPATQLSK